MDLQIVALISIIAAPIIFIICNFLTQTRNNQILKIKEWLIYACIQAEKELGSKTGKIKLRYVYDLFISKYRFISCLISFEAFSILVDEALDQMRKMIEQNIAIENYIGVEK